MRAMPLRRVGLLLHLVPALRVFATKMVATGHPETPFRIEEP